MQTWQEVYDYLGITKEDERLFYHLSREKDHKMCTLAQASDLIEFEQHGTPNHCKVMKAAIQLGDSGQAMTLDDLLKFHGLMFNWGGDFRQCDVLIPNSSHMFPSYSHVPVLMRHYFEDMEWWLTESAEDPYVIMAHLHLDFERIHGFRDGNGRLGRVLLNNHAAFFNLGMIKLTPEVRNTYLDYLEDKDEQGLANLFEQCSI